MHRPVSRDTVSVHLKMMIGEPAISYWLSSPPTTDMTIVIVC